MKQLNKKFFATFDGRRICRWRAWSSHQRPRQKRRMTIQKTTIASKTRAPWSSEILDIPDDIPQDLLDKARCVIVFPSVVKAAFIVGGSYGRGVMTCRTHKDYTGPWGAPTMMALEGGSVGLQIGGQATDFVILVMNNRGADSVLHSKVKLGGDASIAAGPKGRDASAETDVTMRAEMLSYSRARGVFAGISLEGSTVRPDNDANKRVYGKDDLVPRTSSPNRGCMLRNRRTSCLRVCRRLRRTASTLSASQR